MRFDFDEIIDRRNTCSIKYDFARERGMPEGLIPLWVADMDFLTAPEILGALRERTEHAVFGYTVPPAEAVQAVQAYLLREHNW
jgi:cystathionine beta-lyase